MGLAFFIAMFKKLVVRRPAKFKAKAVTDALIEGAEDIGGQIKADYEKTVTTWKTKPEFTADVNSTPDRIEINAGTDNPIFHFLDEGTRVRYATMSQDWVSKTRPAIGGGAAVHFTAGPGRGRKLFVDVTRPRPGIKARKFSSAIKGKWERQIRSQMEKHLARGVKKSGHAYNR